MEVSEVEEVLAYMKEAMINRKKAATNMNERSSRSHLIITLRLEGFSEKNDDKRFGSLVFVDLAFLGADSPKAAQAMCAIDGGINTLPLFSTVYGKQYFFDIS